MIKWLKKIIDVCLFPKKCLACSLSGELLCQKCFRCLSIGAPENNHFKSEYLDRLMAAGDYRQELLREIIKNYKYGFVEDLAPYLAKMLIIYWQGIINLGDNNNYLVIPLPLSRKRLAWRGFNQAETLAKIFCQEFSYRLDTSHLKRRDSLEEQAKLSEKQRINNIKGCFFWTGGRLEGKNILLIDDVATSGATMEEAAKILKTAGTFSVDGLAVARG